MSSKIIVVFGATGTVGAYTCLDLIGKGYEVIASGGRQTDGGFFADYGIQYIQVDIRDAKSFSALPTQNVYGVVNLSGALPARMEGYCPQRYFDVNLTGSLNIYEYCAKVNCQVVITTKSIADVSYLCGNNTPIPSDAVPRFPINSDHSVYCITKNAAADMLTHYSTRHNFKYYILRFPNIYLYHPNPFYYVDGALCWQGYRLMIHKAIRHEPLAIWGNPNIVRDIVYIKDCTQIISLCLLGVAESGIYNVGTGHGVSMREQVQGIIDVFGDSYLTDIPYDLSKRDAVEYVFDITRTVENLGYQVKYDYKHYLMDFKTEMKSQRFVKLWGEDKTGDVDLI